MLYAGRCGVLTVIRTVLSRQSPPALERDVVVGDAASVGRFGWGGGGGGRSGDPLRAAGRGGLRHVAAFTAIAEQDHVVGHHLGDVDFAAVLVIVVARLEPAFE